MNKLKNAPAHNLDAGLVLRLLLFVALFAGAGVGFVFIKVQQHALGEQTRTIEAQIGELHAFNHVLRSELSTMTSHARIREAMQEGMIALVAISDQHIARLSTPQIGPRDLSAQTASTVRGDLVP
jgi:uncharacterized protein HemX